MMLAGVLDKGEYNLLVRAVLTVWRQVKKEGGSATLELTVEPFLCRGLNSTEHLLFSGCPPDDPVDLHSDTPTQIPIETMQQQKFMTNNDIGMLNQLLAHFTVY